MCHWLIWVSFSCLLIRVSSCLQWNVIIYGKCKTNKVKTAFKLRQNRAGVQVWGWGGGTQRQDGLHKRMQGEWAQSARGNMLKRRRINKQFQEPSGSAEARGGYHILYLNTCNEGLFSGREAFRSEVLLIAATREAQLSFITPLLQLRQPLRRFPDVSPLQFLQKCETSDGCLCLANVFIHLIWSEQR